MPSVLSQAVRGLARSPAYTATAVLSIGIAIGLAGSIGSVAYAAFFARPPYPDPEMLVELWQTAEPGNAQPSDYLAPVRMLEWVGVDARHLEGIAAWGVGPSLITSASSEPERIDTAPIVGDWFTTMGVPATRGRVLTLEDARPGAEGAVVVSDRFARERSVDVGSTIELSGTVYTVVGVMPRAFESGDRVWLTVESLPEGFAPVAYAGVARLREGSTVEDATLEIQQMAAAQVAADSARYAGLGATARPFGAMGRGPNRPKLWMLAGVVVAVILIGASNLTQLVLVRAQGRSRSLAVRAALGGGTWKIAQGLAIEGALVGGLGGVIGLALTIWGKDAVRAFLGGDYAFPSEPTVGLPIVGGVVLLAVSTAALLAIEPIRRIGTLDLQGLLQRRAAGSVATPGERRTQRLMVAVQVATCVVLVAAATVLASAYRTLYRIDMRYDADLVVQAKPDYALVRMDVQSQWDAARTVAIRLREQPAIAGVAVWEEVGEDYPPRPEIDAVFDGPPREIGRLDRLARYYAVDPGFFDVLGIDVLAGRPLSAIDVPGQPPVAVVTKRGADAWWPGEDPLGHQVRLGREGTWMTVVGVVEDIRMLDALGRSVGIATADRWMPFLFVAYAQLPTPPVGWRPFDCCSGVMVGVRPASPATDRAAAAALRAAFSAAAPALPVEVASMVDLQVTHGYAGRSIAMTGRMVGAGATIALLLAMVGIVGVVREALTRRTREIGLRMALGARVRQVIGVAAADGVMTALAGIVLGLAVVFPLDRAFGRFVFDYDVRRLTEGVLDPRVLGASVVVVIAVVTATAAIAAGKAARIDPAAALRAE